MARSREYNNQLRLKKAEVTRRTILDNLTKLLVKRKGGAVTFEEIAKASKISVRSVYTFFKCKESMFEAMHDYVLSFFQAAQQQVTKLDVGRFGRYAYELFDKHEDLAMAFVYSPISHETRKLFRKKMSQEMIARIISEKGLEMTLENKKKFALMAALINAKVWHDIRSDSGFNGVEMGPTVEWALNTLINNL
jgi:AcrR family transcriptional regulator